MKCKICGHETEDPNKCYTCAKEEEDRVERLIANLDDPGPDPDFDDYDEV